MVFLTSKLTIGEITFIARIAVQIFAYAAASLLGLLVVGQAPRIAHFQTHDVLNRIIGQQTLTTSSIGWIWRRFTGKSNSQTSLLPISLPIAISLFLTYTLAVKLSDIGLIGIHPCHIPSPPYADVAASVHSDEDALRVVRGNILGDTNPSSIPSERCDYAEVKAPLLPDELLSTCLSWHNSTYGESTTFLSLNSTDSDVLMPKQLARLDPSTPYEHSHWFRGMKGSRFSAGSPKVASGLAIIPHATGVRMIVGVPELTGNKKVHLPKTMAIEADVGCMALGITGRQSMSIESLSDSETLEPTGPWREYFGPNDFYDTLSHYVDIARENEKPRFNKTSSSGLPINEEFSSFMSSFSYFDSVGDSRLTTNGTKDYEKTKLIEADCTVALHKKLQVPLADPRLPYNGSACHFLQLQGAEIADNIYRKSRHALCASSTQVNMVSVTVETDHKGVPSLVDLFRLPSKLNVLNADFWNLGSLSGFQFWAPSDGIVRYTLADDPSGSTNHPIFQREPHGSHSGGAGSAGMSIAQLGSRMLYFDIDMVEADDLQGYFGDGLYGGDFPMSKIAKLLGEKGAAYLSSSVEYNGWVARGSGSPVLMVESTTGMSATCYNMAYGFAFLPLFVMAVIIVAWASVIAARMKGRFSTFGRIKQMYGGLSPLALSTTSPDLLSESLLVWEKMDGLRLELVYDGMVVEGTANQKLVDYIDEGTGTTPATA